MMRWLDGITDSVYILLLFTCSTEDEMVGQHHSLNGYVAVVQSLSCVQFFAMNCSTPASLSFTISRSLLKLMSIESVMPSNHLVLCCLFLLLPSIFPRIRVFSSELALCIRWPQYCSFSFSISPSNEYSGLISFRIDSFDLLAVQRTLKSLLQHHSLKASVLWHLAFYMVQLSHPYMTTGKTIALTLWTFVVKVISLLLLINLYFNWTIITLQHCDGFCHKT